MIYDDRVTGVSRARIVEALRAEGVASVSGAYVNVHLLPMFQTKMAYGRKGFPWVPEIHRGKVDYRKGICPTAEDLHDRSYLKIEFGLHAGRTATSTSFAGLPKVWAVSTGFDDSISRLGGVCATPSARGGPGRRISCALVRRRGGAPSVVRRRAGRVILRRRNVAHREVAPGTTAASVLDDRSAAGGRRTSTNPDTLGLQLVDRAARVLPTVGVVDAAMNSNCGSRAGPRASGVRRTGS
jgi:hypothetical protein